MAARFATPYGRCWTCSGNARLAERWRCESPSVRCDSVCGLLRLHTRGKPPNVVETDPITFVLLATGRLGWAEGVGQGRVSASGIRADLTPYLPSGRPD